jgi:rhamnosyltransferase
LPRHPSKGEIGAVIVLFHPDDSLRANIRSYAEQVGRVVAVDNTPNPPVGRGQEVAALGVDCIVLGENRGIAAALNAGANRLRETGFEWALTMDQDSTAPAGFMDALTDCLLRLSAAAEVDGFDEALFIDQVDTDFCFRLRLAGWRLLQSRRALLHDRQGTLRRTGLGFYVTDYPAIRRYYMTRNTLILRKRCGARFPAWMSRERTQWVRDTANIVLGEPHKLDKTRKILHGVGDARADRLGPYEELNP